ncbi:MULTISPECIES: hypothetical protein [Achromobacter]|uniref:Uncharacterized protein n=1 Tax=Achromobacter mucicolens TaxID=1389922 RepID=A0ABM8LK04_9BURK|nr:MULTISPECIES: hypothetical protein [Achromobacter]AVG44129.1 hypothetical protein MC81_32125 [Achromobacter insolitus]CAB3847347.1 hypothetical protein LMG3410_01587 [Achromobacter aegrifaciens]CAB3912752.1 hypothetical protein LMG3415_05062 [Achromobacter mucicolens]
MQGTGNSISIRESIPQRLAALIAARPERLLSQVELSYAALRRDAEGPTHRDMAQRLLSRTAEVDSAQRNLADWLKGHAAESPEERTRLQSLRQNVNQDLAKLRDVLSVAGALPVVQVKAKALQALLDVHVGVKQLRDLSRKLIQAVERDAAELLADSQGDGGPVLEQDSPRLRQREGEN